MQNDKLDLSIMPTLFTVKK